MKSRRPDGCCWLWGRGTFTVLVVWVILASMVLVSVGLAGGASTDSPGELTECTELDEPGEYVLMADLVEDAGGEFCLEITADGVTVDGQGYVINSSESQVQNADDDAGVDLASGIEVEGSDVTIENVRFVDLEVGVHATDAENVTIRDNEFDTHHVDSVDGSHAKTEVGVQLQHSITNVWVTDNEFDDWWTALEADGYEWQTDHHVDIYVAQNVIRDANWDTTSPQAISIEEYTGADSGVVIEHNEFSDSELGSGQPADIYLDEVPNVSIRHNVHVGTDGSSTYRLRSADGVSVWNNSFVESGGIHIDGSTTEAILTDTEIEAGLDRAIYIGSDVSDVVVSGLTVSGSEQGIWNAGTNTTVEDAIVEDLEEGDYQQYGLESRDRINVTNTSIDGVRLDGTVSELVLTEYAAAFEDASEFEEIEEPLEAPDTYESSGVYLDLRETLHGGPGSWMNASISYAEADTTGLDEADLRVLRYDHDTVRWTVLSTPGTVNETAEHVSANVTQEGTIGLFELEERPSATFAVDPPEPMETETATFDASASTALDGVETYHWDFGDGTTETTTDPTVEHSYDDAGYYDVELAVDDGNDVFDVATQSIEVTAPEAAFEWEPVHADPNETVTFDAGDTTTPADEIDDYHWTFDDGMTETTNEAVVEHTYDETGHYAVELEIEDDFGNSDMITKTVPVTVPGEEIWLAEIDGGTYSPTVADGSVYAGTTDDEVVATDAVTGEKQWSFDAGEPMRTTPAVDNDTVYIGAGGFGDDGMIYAIYAENGTQRWQVETGFRGAVQSSPSVDDGTVYVGSDDGNVYALDAETGEEQWSTPTGANVQTSPAVDDGLVYVGNHDGLVYALDENDGGEEWSVDLDGRVQSSPTVADGTVYVGSNDGHVYALDGADGTEEWNYGTDDSVQSAPAVAGGTVYVGSDDGYLYALDETTGDLKWAYETDDSIDAGPTVADGTVYADSGDDHTYALDADTGEERWIFETGSHVSRTPAVAGEVAYVGGAGNGLYAIDAGPVDEGALTASFLYDPFFPEPGDTVTFDASHADAPEDAIVEYRWDFSGDGETNVNTTDPEVTWSFDDPHAENAVTLTVEAESGETTENTRTVDVDPTTWRFETDFVFSSQTIVDGIVYATGHDEDAGESFLYALDEETGKSTWKTGIGIVPESTPTVVEEMVYVGSDDGNLYGIDASDGEVEWTFPTGDDVTSSPTVADGVVYVGSEDGTVYGVDTATGDESWNVSTGDSVTSSPTVADGVVYVGSEDGSVYALDVTDGEEEWSFPTGDDVTSSPTVVNETVFVGSENGNVYALDATDGEEEWSFPTGDDVTSSPTVANETVFVGSENGNVYALDATDGEEVWSVQTDEFVTSSPTVVDGTLFVGSLEYVYAIETGVDGSSVDSRVELGTLGHWTDGSDPSEPEAEFELSDLAVSDEDVLTDEEVTVTGTVENTGTDGGEYIAELEIDGEVEDSEYLWLDPTESHTLEFIHTFEDPGEYEVTVDGVAAGNVTVSEPSTSPSPSPSPDPDPEPDIAVSNASIDETTIATHDTLAVTVVLENTGDADGENELGMTVGGDLVATETVSVDAGETSELSLTYTFDDVDFEPPGEFDVHVDDVEAGTVTVETAFADIDRNPETNPMWNPNDEMLELPQHDSVDIAGVTNTAPGTNLTVEIETLSGQEVALYRLHNHTVEAGAEINTWTITEDFRDVPAGTELTIQFRRAGVAGTINPDGERVPAVIVAEPDLTTFEFDDQTIDSEEQAVTIDAFDSNQGGAVVIADEDGNALGQSSTLDAGLQESVTISLDEELDDGDHNLTATAYVDGSATQPYGEDRTATVTVSPDDRTPAAFQVSDLTPGVDIDEPGEAASISATVENVGDESDTQTVQGTFYGEVVYEETVTLDAGESHAVIIDLETGGLDFGATYEYTISIDDDSETGVLSVAKEESDSVEDDGEDDTADDETPGFGIVVALLAVLLAVILVRR